MAVLLVSLLLLLLSLSLSFSFLFFFNDTATTEIYTLSLHDALPIFTKEQTHFPVITPQIPLESSLISLYFPCDDPAKNIYSPSPGHACCSVWYRNSFSG